MSTQKTTDSTFKQDVLDSDKPVLVDFWAEWCAPCKMIAPALEEISTQFAEKLTVVKVNVDENPQTPVQFNVKGIPTLILFKNGAVAAQKVGALPKGQLVSWVQSQL